MPPPLPHRGSSRPGGPDSTGDGWSAVQTFQPQLFLRQAILKIGQITIKGDFVMYSRLLPIATTVAALTVGLPLPAHAAAGDRTVTVFVGNDTDFPLEKTQFNVYEGEVALTSNDTIGPSDSDYFGSKSTEERGGTSGSAHYRFRDNQFIRIAWSNPWEGQATFDCRAPSSFTCTYTATYGHNATATFTVSE
ncbi:hypothetical protein [Actinoplanes sp. HUAS TT8]|uniref:hypothetical protein n=1 Tax=Actinoplanes sp. HUAS TT8 TaxID=3447453 RepID=UPI003F526349